ncbi:MAG: ExbD/TolR family protein [Pirellulaceae bacterium]
MAVQPKKHAVGSLSITPLIDVVFLLLIFFLVATRFAEEEREIEIELPTASQSLPLTTEPREMFINIDETGQYFIEGKFRHPEQVEDILRQAAANNPLTQTVVIRADKSTDWQHVLTAFDLCKKAGIYNYTAMTDDQ